MLEVSQNDDRRVIRSSAIWRVVVARTADAADAGEVGEAGGLTTWASARCGSNDS